jgi:hypothetical protein
MHATGHVLLTDFDLSKHASNPVQPKIVTKIYSGATGVVSEPDLITNRYTELKPFTFSQFSFFFFSLTLVSLAL